MRGHVLPTMRAQHPRGSRGKGQHPSAPRASVRPMAPYALTPVDTPAGSRSAANARCDPADAVADFILGSYSVWYWYRLSLVCLGRHAIMDAAAFDTWL